MKKYSPSRNAFFVTEIHGQDIPLDAIMVSEAVFTQMVIDRPADKRLVPGPDGHPTLVDPPPATPEQVAATYECAVQAHMDAAARAAGYDDIKTAVTYADEPAVTRFQTEGAAFRAWRSRCWDYCYTQIAVVQSGARSQPTIPELIAELPVLAIP